VGGVANDGLEKSNRSVGGSAFASRPVSAGGRAPESGVYGLYVSVPRAMTNVLL